MSEEIATPRFKSGKTNKPRGRSHPHIGSSDIVTHRTPARPYLSMRQAATYLGYDSERTVRRLIASGELRAYRLGNKTVRIRQGDLDALLEPIPAGAGEPVA